MISKIKYYFNIAWKKYHFIIPFSEIKRFFKNHKKHDDNVFDAKSYNKWNKNNVRPNLKKLSYKPLISVIIPVYNVKKKYLVECINSVLNQSYENYEICIVDDASTLKETIKTLKEYEKNPKIKIEYHKKNQHISKTSNDAVKFANGEYVVLLDNDDFIDKDALYEVVSVLNENRDIDLIYSDEDKVSQDGTFFHAPFFKPDYSPTHLLFSNYFCHLVTIRKSIFEKIGGFRVGYEGIQDWDLLLRITEKTNKIYHIPKILYHWREISTSTALDIKNKPYAISRTKGLLEETLKRRKINSGVRLIYENIYTLEFKKQNDLVSIIVLGQKDNYYNHLVNLINEITYKNYELIVNKDFLDDSNIKELKNKHVVFIDNEKNNSLYVNKACEKAKGHYILLLSNYVHFENHNWLNNMVGFAQEKNIGSVGINFIVNNEYYYYGNKIWSQGRAIEEYIEPISSTLGIYARLMLPHNVSIVKNNCMLFSKANYKLVKGFDNKLSLEASTADFCLKLMYNGLYNIVEPNIKASIEKFDNEEINQKDQDILSNKWLKIYERDPFYNPNLDDTKPYYLKNHFVTTKHVFIIGSRGYNFNYGGWETFVTNLMNNYLTYNVVFHVSGIEGIEKHYMISNHLYIDLFPLNKFGKLQMYMHTKKSIKYYIKYIKECGITNSYIYLLGLKLGGSLRKYHKKLNKMGIKIMVNPDGLEWKRDKYGLIGKTYFLWAEKSMLKNCDMIVCDSKGIYDYIKDKYKKNKIEKRIISYGTKIYDNYLNERDFNNKYHLKKDDYLLVVGRLVPENNLSFIMNEFLKSKINKKLVIVTNESNEGFINWCQKEHIEFNDRFVYFSSVYNEQDIFSLRKYAWAYIHGHSVGGTNPSLLESLYASPLVIANNVCFNKYVCKDSAIYFSLKENSLRKQLNDYKKIDKKRSVYHKKAINIIEKNHTWSYIANEYKKIWEDDLNE